MAGDDANAPANDDEETFKCHPLSKVSVVICVICDSVYHKSDFKKLKNTVKITKTLVICPEHEDLDITSKKPNQENLPLTARQIIAQIKLYEKEKAHEELLNNVSYSVAALNAEKSNLTIVGKEQDDYEKLQSENLLLTKLVNEMQEKNSILNELYQKTKKELMEKNNQNLKMKTYADIAKTTNKGNQKHIPNIIIRAKNHLSKAKIQKVVTNKLQNEIFMKVNKIHTNKDGTMSVKCTDKEDMLKMEQQLADKIGQEYEVTHEDTQNPRIKVVGIESEMTVEELEYDINTRNFADSELFCTVIHIYKNERKKCINAILEVNAETYTYIRDYKNKLFIGHQCCRVYDDLNINPCFKCGRIGHSTKKCTNEVTCLRCAGSHDTNKCEEKNKIKCLNCDYANTKYNMNRNTDHISSDTDCCEYLKYIIKKKINTTDYPSLPKIPKYLGYNGKLIKSQEETENGR